LQDTACVRAFLSVIGADIAAQKGLFEGGESKRV
jgi:hypothetical protein